MKPFASMTSNTKNLEIFYTIKKKKNFNKNKTIIAG